MSVNGDRVTNRFMRVSCLKCSCNASISERPEPFVSEQFHTVYATAMSPLSVRSDGGIKGVGLVDDSVNSSMLIGTLSQYATQHNAE